MELLPRKTHKYLSCDTVEKVQGDKYMYYVKILNNLTTGIALSDHRLKLYKGNFVVLVRNTGLFKGHVSSLRYTLSIMTPNALSLILAIESKAKNKLCQPYLLCGVSVGFSPNHCFSKTQFPRCVYFRIATNKTQSFSFSKGLGFDLGDNCR